MRNTASLGVVLVAVTVIVIVVAQNESRPGDPVRDRDGTILAEAEPLMLEILENQRRVLGPDHPDTLTSMNNLGGLYTKQGRLDEARPLLRQALDARVRVLGEDHPHVGYSYYNVGCLAAAVGGREDALDFLRKAVGLGWAERDILEDATLDALRGDPEFEAIVAEVKKRIGEE